MKYYPIYLDVKDKPCLVVGGGSVGARKALFLAKCGARVKVVSDVFAKVFDHDSFNEMALEKKPYDSHDLEGMFLVFAATDNSTLNMQISDDARKRNILCNVADSRDNSDFILPSVVDRGDLILTASTSGKSPAMAKQIRKDLEERYGEEYNRFLVLMGRIRKKLLNSEHSPESHRQIFNTLIEKDLLGLVAQNNEAQIDKMLKDVLGQGYSIKNLGLQE